MKDERKRQIISNKVFHNKLPKGWKYDFNRHAISSAGGRDSISDMEIQEYIGDHTCAICGDGPDADIRYLRIGCFYELKEVSEKFRKLEDTNLYYLPFCKSCRGHFMFEILGKWVKSQGHKEHENWNGEALIQYV